MSTQVTVTLYGDDGKGNVVTAIIVGNKQKFWFKGYVMGPYGVTPLANKTVDIWYDEYGPQGYVKSWWLSTQITNQDGYFDQSPYDTEWLEQVGISPDGYPIIQLYQAKQGKIAGQTTNKVLGFKSTLR